MMPRFQASFSVWLTSIFVFVAAVTFSIAGIAADAMQVEPGALSALMRTMDGPEAPELPFVYKDEGGFVRFLGAPSEGRFVPPPSPAKAAGNVEAVARGFVEHHGGAFGLDPARMELRMRRAVVKEGKTFVRLDQYFAGLPVFGAQVVVHVDDDLHIQNVNADIMRDTGALDKSVDFLTPVIGENEAGNLAIEQNAELSGADEDTFLAADAPELVIFEPAVFGMPGTTALAWKVVLKAAAPYERGMVVLIDAHTGEMVLRYADGPGVRHREVYDSDGNPDALAAQLLRKEGEPPTGIETVDTFYDFLGNCYDWYQQQHGRDSYDNRGSKIKGYVNYPILNAFWLLDQEFMVIGEDLLALDVVAHEYTHGVTAADTDLIYFSYAGAITEMYSDQAGEFIDQYYNPDKPPVLRWFIGDDLEFRFPDLRGREDEEDELEELDGLLPGIRYMKDPTAFGDPDRLSSPLLVNPFGLFNLGGVHSNNGIGNKLIYLLTDGDTFNGQTVQGMGQAKVADLFYTARPLLSRAANYYDFYYALRAASVMLDFSEEDRLNVIAGARAVEIEPPGADSASLLGLRDFRAVPTHDFDGNVVVGLNWKNPNIPLEGLPPLPIQISLYRSVTDFPMGAGDGLLLPVSNTDTSYLDYDVRAGEIYYYTLVAELADFRQELFAKARAGDAGLEVYTEVFGYDLHTGNNPFDLSYTQITFQPVLPPPPYGDDPYLSAMDFADYEVTTEQNVYELPVRRDDGGTGAYELTYTDDGWIPVALNPSFPFFGVKYNALFLSSNGYLLFIDPMAMFLAEDQLATLDLATLAAHFALPRISLFFTDLAPHISGQVWGKNLRDRFVVTFENVAVKPGPYQLVLNPERVTAQLELYSSGRIRMTYLNAAMSTGGIVGLSDGRGVPREPADVYEGIRQGYQWIDFSRLPDAPARFSILPVPIQFARAGEVVAFDTGAELPPSEGGTPVFYAEWDGPGSVPFADNGDGTGAFYWETVYEDAGSYNVRVFAELNGETRFQDVEIAVGRVLNVKPTARDLRLSSDTNAEDPTVSRAVSVGRPLSASFEYYHPYAEQTPLLYEEGGTLLYWFRNGQIAPAFTNSRTIPAGVAKANDVWWFQVTAETVSGLKGDPVASPVVSVLGVPKVDEVFPNRGLTTGGDRITIRGSRLAFAKSVTFDGVPAAEISPLNNNEISVLTPVHAGGTVTVAVETAGGIGRKLDAFTFVGHLNDPLTEKERSFLGCGARTEGAAPLWQDLTPALLAVLLLLVAGRMQKRGENVPGK